MSGAYSSGHLLRNPDKGWNMPDVDTTSQIAQLGYYGFYNNWYLAEYLYRESWACRRVVDYYPDKMIKKWGTLRANDNEDLVKELQDQLTQLKRLYNQGQKTANTGGDGYVLRLVDDGRDVWEPIDFEDVREVRYSRVLSIREVEARVDYDEHNYYDPEYYEVSTTNHPYQVFHKSRVIRFSGNFLTPDLFERNNYCFASTLEPIYKPYVRLEQSLAHVAEAMTSFEFILFGVRDLLEASIQGDEDALACIREKYRLAQKQMSSNRGVIYDLEDQKIQIAERKFTNIDNIIQEVFRKELIASSGLTQSQLYNEHPGGLNNTGRHELIQEADRVLEYQELKWSEKINFDCKLLLASKQYFDDFKWNWINTYQPTKEEEIEQRKTIAETDKIYAVDIGAVTEQEIRKRFEDNEYSEELILDENVDLEAIAEQKQQRMLEMTKTQEPKPEEEKTDRAERFRPSGALIIESKYSPSNLNDLSQIDDD